MTVNGGPYAPRSFLWLSCLPHLLLFTMKFCMYAHHETGWTLCFYVALVFPDGQSWLRHLILEGWYLVGLCSIEKTRQTILWLTCLPFHWQVWCVFCTAVNHIVCFLNVFTIDPLSPHFGSSPFGVHHLLSELPTWYAGSSILHYVDISQMTVIALSFLCVLALWLSPFLSLCLMRGMVVVEN